MIDFSGVSMPFNVGELLQTTMSLINLVAPYILLALTLYFTPLIRGFVAHAVGNKRYAKELFVSQRQRNRRLRNLF